MSKIKFKRFDNEIELLLFIDYNKILNTEIISIIKIVEGQFKYYEIFYLDISIKK